VVAFFISLVEEQAKIKKGKIKIIEAAFPTFIMHPLYDFAYIVPERKVMFRQNPNIEILNTKQI